MSHHLNDKDIAGWLATEDSGDVRDPAIKQHLSECDECRWRVDRAKAMLDVAAAEIAPDDPTGECPDANRLAAYVDNRLVGDDADVASRHVAECPDCAKVAEVVAATRTDEPAAPTEGGGGPSRSPTLRFWLSGGVLLAAACVALVFFYAGTPPVELNVRVFAPGATRATTTPAGASEFAVEVVVEQPAWVALLVVDEKGELMFLTEQHVETSSTFGRYGTTSPGAESSGSQRRFVILLVSPTSLVDNLAKIDVEAARLGADSEENARVISNLCDRLEKQLACRAKFAPIESTAARQ